MQAHYNLYLIIAAVLSGIAAILHVAIIIGGARWYRFFGAGERMARAAEAGRLYPTLLTSGIVVVLGVWAAYALSGAGVLAVLPMRKLILSLITAVYLLRGLLIVPLLTGILAPATPFMIWSSLVCLIYGAVHSVGVSQAWHAL